MILFSLRTWAVSSFGPWENTKTLIPLSCRVSAVPFSPFTRMIIYIHLRDHDTRVSLLLHNVRGVSHYTYSLLIQFWFILSRWGGRGLNQRGCGNDRSCAGLQRPSSRILSVFPDPLACSVVPIQPRAQSKSGLPLTPTSVWHHSVWRPAEKDSQQCQVTTLPPRFPLHASQRRSGFNALCIIMSVWLCYRSIVQNQSVLRSNLTCALNSIAFMCP